MKMSRMRVLALAEALLVTFLRPTSYVLIKIDLREINLLAFAAYRYVVASIILVLFPFYRYRLCMLRLNLKQTLLFLMLGFTSYFMTQV